MTTLSGTRLGRYEVRSQIGEGGMGVVYRARDPKIGRDVAIKVLPLAFSTDAERLARFEQEARAAGALNHPNVLAVLDVGHQEGGSPTVALKGKGLARRWLQFLPDGRRYIFYKLDEGGDGAGIYAGTLGSAEITKVLAMPPGRPQYVKGGYLLYPREGTLVAQAFDEKSLRVTGEPVVVVERLLHFDKTGWAEFSASETGVLAYIAEYPKTRLVWMDREGHEVGQAGPPGEYVQARLSPDGHRAALVMYDPRVIARDLWILDLSLDTRTRFVSGPTDDGDPVWSHDGRRLAYFSCCEEASTLHIKETGDTGKGEVPVKDQLFVFPSDWSQDGKYIVYQIDKDIWAVPLFGEGKPYPLVKSPSNETEARLSPDGRWVAFVSDETGRTEVYITGFEHPGEKWRVSTEGGSKPRWRRDGRELFYISTNPNRLMAVEVRPGDRFDAGAPSALFGGEALWADYDVTADGRRFIFVATGNGNRPLPFTVVLNWAAEIKK